MRETVRPGEPSEALLPSGAQFEIQRGGLHAIITEVGAGLRSLSADGRELLDTYGPGEMALSGRGQVLLPWPGRIADGCYVFEGTTYQLPLSEPAHLHAIHGLTRWLNWRVVSHEAHRLVLELLLHAQTGYPFVLALRVRYTLTDNGLEVETLAENPGAAPLPYGAGYHPYFTVGTELVDSAILHIPARAYLRTNERLIPVPPPLSVAGTPFDFRVPHPIGDLVLDTSYTDLLPDADGFTRVTLSAPEGGPGVTVFMDAHHPFLQVYTGDSLSNVAQRRRGIAIEPYTSAANAFNNGYGLQVLQPGESFTSLWGIALTTA